MLFTFAPFLLHYVQQQTKKTQTCKEADLLERFSLDPWKGSTLPKIIKKWLARLMKRPISIVKSYKKRLLDP